MSDDESKDEFELIVDPHAELSKKAIEALTSRSDSDVLHDDLSDLSELLGINPIKKSTEATDV